MIPSTSTTDIPTGLGLMGEQVLNTPVSLPWCDDVCRRNSGENPGLRWKLKITTMRWPGSMSRSPSEYCSSMTSVPSTLETLQCRGALRRPYGRSRWPSIRCSYRTLCVYPSIYSLPPQGTAYGYSPGTRRKVVERSLDLVTPPGPAAPAVG